MVFRILTGLIEGGGRKERGIVVVMPPTPNPQC